MINIICAERCSDREQTRGQVNEIARTMASFALKERRIGLYADISPVGVKLILAAIKLGMCAAICPLREPAEVIRTWLSELNITKLFSSVEKPEIYRINTNPMVVGDVHSLPLSARQGSIEDVTMFSSIMRTSGTTSRPKSALIHGHAHKASAQAVNNYFSFTRESCWALSLPLYHVSGLSIIFRSVLAEAAIYLAKTHDDILFGLAAKKITHLSLVPTQLKRLLAEKADFSAVKAIIIGGDCLPAPLKDQAVALDLPLYETYGLTESASMVWVRDVRHNRAYILPHAQVKIGADQEIVVGGASLFDGYLDQKGKHEVCREGLFATGDLGFLAADQLHISGRKHHRIISGGENIQPEEIERILEQHPRIETSVVVGLSDPSFGMRPYAIIRWQGVPLSLTELNHYLRQHLASYKLPEAIFLWPHHAPEGLKKPRKWLQEWACAHHSVDTAVIVGA